MNLRGRSPVLQWPVYTEIERERCMYIHMHNIHDNNNNNNDNNDNIYIYIHTVCIYIYRDKYIHAYIYIYYTCMRNFTGVTLKRRPESIFWSYGQFPLSDWPRERGRVVEVGNGTAGVLAAANGAWDCATGVGL